MRTIAKKRVVAGVLALSASAFFSLAGAVAQAALPLGHAAPDFKAEAAKGGQPFTFDLAATLAKGPVVLYFYPAAFTSGCTIEARNFAEAIPQYTALGATVVGVSGDDIGTLKRFSESECQGKFAVAADKDGRIMKAYDAAGSISATSAQRISYVITPDGKVIEAYAASSPDRHVAETLQALKTWRTKNPQ
ncbi:peroxiredoxin [Schauerella aestuarii]|uniref:peroxiredoxin n=1 Tax=Schauerella aestuarii TaxID=2511204 RepID=UPI00136D9C4C|nr:peroxiredoxin [Achromobacter aestuarii]MYZ44812.1 peroxiredoxin [Achromobacter aestuarii]